MRIRNVLREYEAQLHPTGDGAGSAGSARGKAEWKTYENGTSRCRVRVSGLNLSEGAALQLSVGGEALAEILVQQGKAGYRRESERGEAVPEVAPHQVLQVFYAGQIILEGEFNED